VAGLNLVTLSALKAAILVWDLGVSSFILAVLFKKLRSLDTLLMKCRFGFWL
jgi:hypothetical protein